MKNKNFYTLAVIVVLTVVFIWVVNQLNIQSVSSTNSELMPLKRDLLDLQKQKDFQSLSKQEKLERVYEVLEKMPPKYNRLKRQYLIAMSSLPDITLYGRVIDQYGQPVSDADVYYAGTNAFLAAGGGRGVVKTDDDGYFEIETSGEKLSLWGIRHPSIEEGGYPKASNTNLDIKSSNMYPDWTVHNTKDNPYIILAWRLGKYEGAIAGSESLRLSSDGTMHTLNLDKSSRKKNLIKGKFEGQFRISCQRSHMESNRDYGDWSIVFSAINGGFLETDDLYMNIAPESGYQPSFNINMKKGTQEYKHELLNKRFYFMANSGQEYGSLIVDFQPFYNSSRDVCNIRLRYKINPTGSRNLELKRDSTSQPTLPGAQKLASNL